MASLRQRRRSVGAVWLCGLVVATFLHGELNYASAFSSPSLPIPASRYGAAPIAAAPVGLRSARRSFPPSKITLRAFGDDKDQEEVEEEARLKVLEGRRSQIRSALKNAESLRNFRINNGFVPELDDDGKPLKSDSQFALTLTAFVVAAGAVILRVGGRAALVSTLGLDFANENPELKDSLDSILATAESLNIWAEAGLFILAWTLIKVFCFDAGGIVLALASGILFGGVIQGAVFCALSATIGSSVAFGLAKLDTPVRKKALEIVDEYPSLRGIEKVVARDGLKAILTLRLAPVLPIPIGMYNYVYGVTNVPFLDFAGGIFLGSMKPYLLDSYLGVFGKTVVDGTAGDAATSEDVILLVALGVSVLIGVFASQLAGETWESVTNEIEAEKREQQGEVEEDDGVMREIMGMKVPQVAVGFQLALKQAEDRINDMIDVEYEAKVWNYTKSDAGPPKEIDPAFFPDSPEVIGKGKGFDVAASVCDGLVLSSSLFMAYLKYADPLYNGEEEPKFISDVSAKPMQLDSDESPSGSAMVAFDDQEELPMERLNGSVGVGSNLSEDDQLFEVLQSLRARTEKRLQEINEKMD
uniref:VTT domain-containing protein n=1 Tax=Trieres chinensis TaxID=1514140 RepID=A0A7S1ZBI6_TRICV|mmetsp:Transcript_21604/g.43669  ORF Transcript_21604/g.43669 Transcript_21604/m.43669 type:complete len:586 (+) Transcript_21604:188-1945(+)|eukprot:CAMPEP_0183297462 /NCGR_PEP_ID=MMETSP0160_2-20130417/4753_1 /TAXON_ID=2839 ORGANISM="Odontella Sinensis, Strain Grunow 1884" /NCGR_SAMPLE_ID=MMETSP0160_2 /ASSEMBLY_ACC=CAM_ASM_000250 /LENGTH=585 /DNA_ID=CAMNT_0025459293 /DNA_START=185 /DNA_END=1942 /DNA_ORIENTATION=-